MHEPEDMATYILRTRTYVTSRLDDVPTATRFDLPTLPQWGPDLERAVSLYVILNVVRTQLHKTEDKFQGAKDKLNNADHYELKRVMALIEDRI